MVEIIRAGLEYFGPHFICEIFGRVFVVYLSQMFCGDDDKTQSCEEHKIACLAKMTLSIKSHLCADEKEFG